MEPGLDVFCWVPIMSPISDLLIQVYKERNEATFCTILLVANSCQRASNMSSDVRLRTQFKEKVYVWFSILKTVDTIGNYLK